QARERRALDEDGAGERARGAQGAGLPALRRAGRPERQDQSDALRDLQRRQGVRGAPADAALQEIPRRGRAAARFARAPGLEARKLIAAIFTAVVAAAARITAIAPQQRSGNAACADQG